FANKIVGGSSSHGTLRTSPGARGQLHAEGIARFSSLKRAKEEERAAYLSRFSPSSWAECGAHGEFSIWAAQGGRWSPRNARVVADLGAERTHQAGHGGV